MSDQVKPLFERGLVPIEDAATAMGVDPKRLRGAVMRNNINDPIGDLHSVYGWSCKPFYTSIQPDRENDNHESK